LSNNLSRLRADKRIGPHNKIVLDLIFGSLLGDGHAERRKIGNGTRITFYQEAVHVSYLL
jgi:ubiquinol-cytochrome c reductase cytochrome b subunit